ncbi:MAG: MerR family transcriptional regulator [Oscillospiraceae bacterium]|nr:MerR family transcriptional regulator [Oscillospiraceae bacterium]
MLTVGNFAALCACTPQTLRYYDRAGLLKPLRVDPWTGYRYYEESQLRDYWRIKDYQQAGFSIGEIRKLLRSSEEEVREALDRKLAREEERLRRLRALREAYHTPTEPMNMEAKVEEARNSISALTERIGPADLEEVGLGPEALEALRAQLRKYWDDFLRGVSTYTAREAGQERDTGWVRSGWEKAAEALRELPPLEEGGTYRLGVCLKERKTPVTEHFLSVLLGAVLLQNQGKKLRLAVQPDEIRFTEENVLRLYRAE